MKQAAERCRSYRRRILDISQRVGALHVGGAFSSVEIVDCIYNELMKRPPCDLGRDCFVLSKGHAAILQYVILESIGVLAPDDLAGYCTAEGSLGVHPDRKTAGIDVSTGALGHGLAMALGMALADKVAAVYVLASDGELQEGSTWEAVLMASSLKANNLVLFIDNNDFQSASRASDTHPTLYPIAEKFKSFGWEAFETDGHDSERLRIAAVTRTCSKPFVVIAKTIKGRGVSYMENVPMWHYRSPNPQEYAQAVAELEAA